MLSLPHHLEEEIDEGLQFAKLDEGTLGCGILFCSRILQVRGSWSFGQRARRPLATTGEAAPCDNGRGGPLRACGHPRLNFGHGKLKEPEFAEFVL